ncbi:MAG: glycosyltransferase family 4 protein [Thermoplasmata archaeon]|nr:MAG: glycosyltransferase family 4 protein [Thermoplasmata archaeon]
MGLKVYELGEFDTKSNVGVVTSTNTLIKYLKRTNLDIEYITYDHMPKKKVFIAYKFLSFLNRCFPRVVLTINIRNLWVTRAIQEMGKDAIIHIHSFILLPELLQSLRIPRKVILSFYGLHSGIIGVNDDTNPYYLRAIVDIPDIIIADELDRNILLDQVRKYSPGHEEILKKKLVLFPFIGIDDEVFNPTSVDTHGWYEHNLKKEGLIVFKGGAIENGRGDKVLIKTAEEILSKRKDIYFIWAGYFRRYPEKEQIVLKRALMKLSKKYPKNVFYMGKYRYSDLPFLLKGADVVPHFHIKEWDLLSTFGREAVMMGRYMLASNIGWYKDFLAKSKGLRVFDWQDDDKLIKESKDELIYLSDNIGETRKKGLENRTYALKYCSARVSAQQHKMIYEALANNESLPTTEELLSFAQKGVK